MYSQWLNEQFARHPDKTKADLAKALGLEPPAISKILNGTRQLKAHELEIIKSFFGVKTPGIVTIDQQSGAYEYKVYTRNSGLSESQKNKQPAENWVLPPTLQKNNAFEAAKKLPGARIMPNGDSAMEPEFSRGTFVVIDSHDKIPPGIFMITDGYSQMIRRCETVTERNGKPQIRISAHSKNFIPQILDRDDIELVGRVVGKIDGF